MASGCPFLEGPASCKAIGVPGTIGAQENPSGPRASSAMIPPPVQELPPPDPRPHPADSPPLAKSPPSAPHRVLLG